MEQHITPFQLLKTIQEQIIHIQPPEQIGAAKEFNGIVFQLHDRLCTTPVESIVQIMRMDQPITALPFVPVWIRGLISKEGDIVVVVDLMEFVHQLKTQTHEHTRLFIYQIMGSWIGIMIPKVTGYKKMNGQRVPLRDATIPYAVQALQNEEGLYPILDITTLLETLFLQPSLAELMERKA